MLLTIGMIVKNEEKYLRRCLTAIQPILKNVDSELIIVDTGSTDKTVEIAKEFTDKVLFFEWINDFAAARNHGLKQAKGEWFMFLDADEIFVTCDSIIDFFNSGTYKEYNSAVYGIKNFVSEDNHDVYTNIYVPRLTRLLPETEFVSPVHERFNTYGAPIMVLHDVADHFGYAFSGNAEMKEEKFKRNSELLLKRLETDEKYENPSLFSQLFDTYCFLEDKTQAIDYAYQGIELCKKQENDFVLALYHSLTVLHYVSKKFEDVLRIYDEYFEVDDSIRQGERCTDLEMYAYRALSLYELQRFEEAYESFRKFIAMFDRVYNKELCTREILYTVQRFNNEHSFDEINVYYTECCMKTGRYSDAEKSFKNSPASHFTYAPNIYNLRIRQEVQLLSMRGCSDIIKMYNNHDKKGKKNFFDTLRYTMFMMKDEDRKFFINKFHSMNLENTESRNIISLYRSHFLGDGMGEVRINTFIEKFGADHPDLLFLMMDEKLDISPYVKACENIEDNINRGFAAIEVFGDAVKGYSPDNIKDTMGIFGTTKLYLQSILHLISKKAELGDVMQYAGDVGIMYLQTFGEEHIPEEIMAAVTIAEIELLRKNRNFKECIAALRRLIKINNKYAPIAREYQSILKAEVGQ